MTAGATVMNTTGIAEMTAGTATKGMTTGKVYKINQSTIAIYLATKKGFPFLCKAL